MPIRLGNGIVSTEVDDFEKKSKVVLPDKYRDFLKNVNGVFLSGSTYCSINIDVVDDGQIEFQELYGINVKNKNMNIEYINNKYLDEIHNLTNALIIGADPGGNNYVLNLENGNILYWDVQHIHLDGQPIYEETDDEGNLYLVSDDFVSFYTLVFNNIQGDLSKEELN